jgi:DNA primase
MDCVAMVQHGYQNTVATLGTACSSEHLKLLSRYAKVVYVLYDGDAAGQAAILRLTELCWESNLDLKVIMLPPTEDPASLLTSGKSLTPFFEAASDILTFFVKTVGTDFLKKSLADKLDISKKIVELINNITDPFKQELLLQQTALTLQVPIETLKALLMVGRQQKYKNPQEKTPPEELHEKSEIELLEEKIFSAILADESNLLLNEKSCLAEPELFSCFSAEFLLIIKQFLALKKEYGSKRAFELLCETVDEGMRQRIIVCAMEPEERNEEAFDLLLNALRKQQWKQRVLHLKAEITIARNLGNHEQVTLLLEDFSQLKQEAKNKGLV